MKFLRQRFQKLEHEEDRQTDRQTHGHNDKQTDAGANYLHLA